MAMPIDLVDVVVGLAHRAVSAPPEVRRTLLAEIDIRLACVPVPRPDLDGLRLEVARIAEVSA